MLYMQSYLRIYYQIVDFCKEEWGENLKARIERFLAGYKKLTVGRVRVYITNDFPNTFKTQFNVAFSLT